MGTRYSARWHAPPGSNTKALAATLASAVRPGAPRAAGASRLPAHPFPGQPGADPAPGYGRFIWHEVGVLASQAGIMRTSWKLNPVPSTLYGFWGVALAHSAM